MATRQARIKLLILPHEENLCVVSKPTDSINDLQQLISEMLMQFPMYRTLLNACTLILELRINGEDFAISGSYIIQEILTNKDDIIVVKFINKSNDTLQQIQPESIPISSISSMINENNTAPKYPSYQKTSIPILRTNKDIIDRKQEIEQKQQYGMQIVTETERLSNDRVYLRLQSEVKPKHSFFYQYVPDPQISLVLAINILIEYLPNSIIKILFLYLPNQPKGFDVADCLKNGWEVHNDVLHDYPDIYVENVLPIQNQPSLILTVGLPGSGKTTWAKIRVTDQQSKYVIAADDYFDRFNNGDFNVKLLSKAHDWAQLMIDNALKAGYNAVASNTNTTLPEMHAYVTKVVFGELPHKVIFAIMPETNINVLIKRGLHGVPPKKCMEMMKRMNYWLQHGPPSIDKVLKAGEFRRFPSKQTSKEVIYTAIFMDKETQNKLRRYFVAISGKALLCDITDCHLTLKYQPLYDDVDMLPFGKRVYLKIIGYSAHEYVQCFIVDIMDDGIRKLCTNKYAHITISFNKSMVRPNDSNELLLNGKVIPIINNFDIENNINMNNYNNLYRNINNINNNNMDICGGGLIIDGIIGAFYKNPNGGIYLEPPYNPNNYYNDNNIGGGRGRRRKRG